MGSTNDFTGFLNDAQLTQNALVRIKKQTNNPTMNSMGLKNIIIFRSEDLSFLHNPIELAKAIKSSPIQTLLDDGKISDIRTNKKKNLITIEFSPNGLADLGQIAKIERIGSWKVKGEIPHLNKVKHGVISPIDINTDLNELGKCIKARYSSVGHEKVDIPF